MAKKEKSKGKKQRKSKQDFAQKLAQKLRDGGLGVVDEGAFSDDSGRWVELKVKDTTLCFSFDMKGESMDKVALYQDKVEVVDQTRVWSTKPKVENKVENKENNKINTADYQRFA